jgi:hypothetical protein
MALNHPQQGEGYVSAYQIAATPFVTSSTVALGATREITFPQITRSITIKNLGASTTALAFSFTQAGLLPANSNYFILSGSESFSGELRTDRLFVSGNAGTVVPFSLMAGLTFIPSKMLTPITGSNGFSGVG